MSELTLVNSISVHGRRWFQRTYGNTYHTCKVLVNGEAVFTAPKQYGYGDQYLQTALDALKELGLIEPERYGNGGSEALWRYCERNGITFSYEVADVERQRDLH